MGFDKLVVFLEGRLCDAQGSSKENSVDQRPEQHNRYDDADDGGHPTWQKAVSFCRHEAQGQSEESHERDQDCEDRQRNQGDFEWMHRIDRLQLHQLTDRILPLRCLPETDDGNDRAAGRGGELGNAQETVEPRNLHVGQERTAEYAEAVSGRQSTSR